MEVAPVPDWGTIPRMLRDRARTHGAVEVVSTEDVTLTLEELRDRAAQVARSLIAVGVEPGDRVAVWAPNTPDWVVTCYGLWDAGAAVAPLSTRFRGIEAAEVLRKTGAKALFVAEGFMDTSYLAMLEGADLPDLKTVVPYGGDAWAEFLALGESVSPEAAEERALAVRPDGLAEIMATSGTTGAPKGVMLQHWQLLRGYWDWAELVTVREGDRYPIIAPFSHGFGINAGLLACVLRAATMMPIALFQPDALLDLIETRRVSVIAGAPAMFFKLLDELPGRDVSSLRVAICGAAAVPSELIRRMLAEAGVERMINAYGLMEGTVVSMTRPGDPIDVIAGTTGRAVPGVELRIVDDEGKDLPSGERGEILVGGYGVMPGYWRDPERTAEAVDADGWLHTGDIGTLDEAGNLAIVDRKKEMFIANGFNGYPAEIEALLLRCPGVTQVAVVGIPDAAMGEAACAFVIGSASPEEVRTWAKANMSNYKVPRRVVPVEALPLNVNGKVDKISLRASAS
ncbi:acyl-CoA synthetase (AMP-forming)/AMP-acid ligase II [Actinocorallia herbida]|uniref:Acyl-CoA synthetase (AMP-forming)/AMP-acid ligase II n=1 Tax=Actinocorallia herbida TaxID=58109 RepID=A0A3N1CQF5_9ACTN|nr:AMP-binding protein [Actinocorallia herbida]ROO83542.1 acyl-CoA synthetase (AMP-forming)/AMP-acid ligase II [Actinocorallia herbida]